jgi:hypothetical protein
MSSQPIISLFPNSTSLKSSKLTPDTLVNLLQPLVIQILLGENPPKTADPAFSFIRIGWQDEGQPGPTFGNDYCALTATDANVPYSQVRDGNLCSTVNAAGSLDQNMTYVAEWRARFSFWGPNSYANASLLISAMSLDWVLDYLENSPQSPSRLYPLPHNDRPVYAPENYQRRWWKRADLVIRFYELVFETTTLPAADSVGITLTTDTGITRTIAASAS